MSVWQLERTFPEDNKSSFEELNPGSYLLGRSPDANIVCSTKTASREHARLEIRSNNVLITDLGSANGTFVNGERIFQTTKIKAGDQFKIGAQNFELHSSTTPAVEEAHLSLYFATRNQRKKLGALPYFIGYDVSKKQVFGTSDPYHEDIVLKLDLGPEGVICRNITGSQGFQLNNVPFQTAIMRHGDKLSTPGEDIVFESGFGSLTGFSEFNSSADELTLPSKSYKIKITFGVLAILILLVSVGIYYQLAHARWYNARTEAIKLYQPEAKAYEKAFLITNGIFTQEGYYLEFLKPYQAPYYNLRQKWTQISANGFLGTGMSVFVPQINENLDAIFRSMDEIFEFTEELGQLAPLQQKLLSSLQVLADTTSVEELQDLREVASHLQPGYAKQKDTLREVFRALNQLTELNAQLSQMTEFALFLRLEEQFNNQKSTLQQQNDAFIKLDHLCTNLLKIIPE